MGSARRRVEPVSAAGRSDGEQSGGGASGREGAGAGKRAHASSPV